MLCDPFEGVSTLRLESTPRRSICLGLKGSHGPQHARPAEWWLWYWVGVGRCGWRWIPSEMRLVMGRETWREVGGEMRG